MDHRILVGYASWAGSTAEVAEVIGETLRSPDTPVEVRSLAGLDDVDGYGAFVLGTGVHAGRVHKAFSTFVERHREALAAMPVAYFVVCLTMKEDTEENRCKAAAFLDKVQQEVPEAEPFSVGLFGGALRAEGEGYAKLPLPLRLVVRAMAKEQGDYRDWEAVRGWAKSLAPALRGADLPSSRADE
jgi:menaquinone-dependent protoporphyrinogen oxidase